MHPLVWAGLGFAALKIFGEDHGPGVPAPPMGPFPGPSGPVTTPPAGHAGGTVTADTLAAANALAPQIATDVKSNGKAYDKDRMKSFQGLVGIWVDGMYGPKTAGAVGFFTGDAPPAPLYSDKYGSKTVVPFSPPAGVSYYPTSQPG